MEENNINDILGIENSQSQSIDNPTSNSLRYPALRTFSIIYLVFAWIIGVAAIFVTFYFLSEKDTQIYSLISLVFGGLLSLSLAAISESIKVFLDIEYNTRKVSNK